MCGILHFESQYSFIDQFHTLLRIVSSRISEPFDYLTIERLPFPASQLNDNRLSNLSTLANRAYGIAKSSDHEVLFQLIESYAHGEYPQCIEVSTTLLREDPTYFLLYDVLAASAASVESNGACPNVFGQECVGQLILSSLFDWYSARVSRRESLEQLRRLARAPNPISLGDGVAGFVALFDNKPPPLGSEQISPLATTVPLPQFALSLSSPDAGLEYIANFRASLGNVAAVDTVETYLSLCKDRNSRAVFHSARAAELRYIAGAQYLSGELRSAVSTLRELRSTAMKISRLHPELYVAEASALLALREHEGAASVMADLLLIDRRLIAPVVLGQVATLLRDEQVVVSRHNIAWPILAAAVHRDESHGLSVDRVHDFVGDYIESQLQTHPIALLHAGEEISLQLQVFLKDCCTPDVLESSIWYSSQEEVLKERLTICQALHDNGTSPDQDVLNEIADLTRRLAILDITSRIERSRIFVDSDAIIQRLDEGTWSSNE